MIELSEIRESGVYGKLMGFDPTVRAVEDYWHFVKKGFEPMLDWRFKIDFQIRLQLQFSIFGKNIYSNDDKFFHWIWERSEHYCREYMTPLYEYSAVNMSHVITKGAHNEMRHDTRNIIILCELAHRKWETEANINKAKMNIWPESKRIIKELKSDYML